MIKIFSTLFFFPFLLMAQENVSNSDLAKKLDLILQKIDGLEERVSKLESENAEVKKEVQAVAKSAQEAKSVSESLAIPQNEEEKKSFFNKLRIGIESDSDQSKGAWTRQTTWNKMKKNLTRFQVRKILGNPNNIRIDLDPRIDQVYEYYGDLNADGEKEKAEVKFYRDRVKSYTTPF